jgi:hypothetical protein
MTDNEENEVHEFDWKKAYKKLAFEVVLAMNGFNGAEESIYADLQELGFVDDNLHWIEGKMPNE